MGRSPTGAVDQSQIRQLPRLLAALEGALAGKQDNPVTGLREVTG